MNVATDGGAPALVIDFDDTRLLAPLFGEHDRHLARIEQRLGLSLVPRGNRVAILGEAHSARVARAALEDLYQRLKGGLEVTVADVDGAVRMAEAQPVAGEAALAAAAPKPRRRRDGKPLEDGQASQGRTTGSEDTLVRTQKRLITPRSPNQAAYVAAMRHHDLVFGLGPAGTGKTYLAVAVAVSMLLEEQIERIILTRPAVEAGERLGFLPGALEEKVDPYMRPMYDALYDMMPGDRVLRRRDAGDIEVAPLAYMRGRTLSNACIILDEAQNTTSIQMKMFLTRMGENSRMVVTGDPSQVDLPTGTRSGLQDAVEVLSGIDSIKMIEFGADDVVRHPLVATIVRAYDRQGKQFTSGR
ncbi:MAG: PhoH family protein [Proteobacteria bacterium]|nr:PhoH family protein [Pseudomonadota bacterium]